MQPLHWGANVLFLDPFPLPSGQRLTLTVTGWVSDVHPAPHMLPSSPRVEEEGGKGKGESGQAYSAAPTLTPSQPYSSPSRRRIPYPPTFP
jgi:hypothetical protein